MTDQTTVQEGRIKSITFNFDSRITLWLTGDDIMTDYFPAYHRLSQKAAKATIAEIGMVKGCKLTATNDRDAGKPVPAHHVRAQKFAKAVGVEYLEQVWFPKRETIAEAQADMSLEPNLDLVVIHVGDGFAENSAIFRHNIVKTTTREFAERFGKQIVADREAVLL